MTICPARVASHRGMEVKPWKSEDGGGGKLTYFTLEYEHEMEEIHSHLPAPVRWSDPISLDTFVIKEVREQIY